VVKVDFEIATGSKFVEVVTGDVGMKRKSLCDLGGGDALAIAGEEIDLASSVITKGGSYRGDSCGKGLVTLRIALGEWLG
jgi:hypothetical protein